MTQLLNINGEHLTLGWELSRIFDQAIKPVITKYIAFGCQIAEIQSILLGESYSSMQMMMFTEREDLIAGKDKLLTDQFLTEKSVPPKTKALYDDNKKNEAAMHLSFDYNKAIYPLMKKAYIAGNTPQDIMYILLAVNHEIFVNHAFLLHRNKRNS